MTYLIPALRLEKLTEKLSKIFKKFTEAGIPFSFNVSEPFYKEVEIDDNQVILQFVNIDVSGFYRIGDYEVIALCQYIDGFNEITAIKDGINVEELEKYRYRDICDHCKSQRKRNRTFIIKQGFDIKQIGSSCIKEYLGIDPTIYASYYEALEYLTACESIAVTGNDAVAPCYRVTSVLKVAYDEIISNGYVARYDSDKCVNDNSTYAAVLGKLNARNKPSYEHIDISNIIDFINNASEDNTYFNNLKLIVGAEFVSEAKLNLLVSSIQAYNRSLITKQVADNSYYYGAIGDKITITGDLSYITNFYTAFGLCYMYKIMADNYTFIWSTSKEVRPGCYKVKGIIKKHKEFNNVKQTVLTNCRLEALDMTSA